MLLQIRRTGVVGAMMVVMKCLVVVSMVIIIVIAMVIVMVFLMLASMVASFVVDGQWMDVYYLGVYANENLVEPCATNSTDVRRHKWNPEPVVIGPGKNIKHALLCQYCRSKYRYICQLYVFLHFQWLGII